MVEEMRGIVSLLLAGWIAAAAAQPPAAAAESGAGRPPPAASAADAGPAAARRPRIGLVLSGGGARGFAHIGVLKALRELRVPVDVVAGTSMGAIVGGAFAAGYTPAELEQLVGATDWDNIFSIRPPRGEQGWRQKEDDYKNLSGLEFGLRSDVPALPRGVAGTQQLELFLRRLTGPVKDIVDLDRLPLPFAAAATDFATGKLVVLREEVSLSTAMRASMSVPGVFPPVARRGRTLVDGGLVRNLPVDLARALGAEVVIAVNVGTPLLPAEQLDDIIGAAAQLANILGQESVERSIAELGPDDLLLTPALGALTAGDFARHAEFIAAGAAAAQAQAGRLRALAADAAAFDAHEARRSAVLRADVPVVITQVQVEGLRAVDPGAVRAQIDVPLGTPLTADEIGRKLRRVYAGGDFESVRYSLVGPPGARELVVTPVEKSWGYNVLRLGGNVQTNFEDDNTFNLLLAHSWRWINRAGAEWRNEVQIGQRRRLMTAWFQPFFPGSHLHLLPHVEQRREERELFLAGVPIGRFENLDADATLNLGLELGQFGVLRAGWGRARLETQPLIGPFSGRFIARAAHWQGGATLDTLDNVVFPRRGGYLDLRWRRYDRDVGARGERDAVDAEAILPLTIGRGTLALSARFGQSVFENGVQFGGLFNLSGTRTGAVSGARGLLLRAAGFRNISDAFAEMRMPIYLGLSLEAAGVSAPGERLGSLRRAAALFVGADSLLGPVYLGLGRTFGGDGAAYLYWGRPQ